MISKELLSEVLGCDCVACYFEDTYNLINYKYEYDVTWSEETQYDNSSINIYELAHKCKEWAVVKQFYNVASLLDYTGYTCIIRQNPMTFLNTELRFRAGTEPKAIFKACQWILEQKRKQYSVRVNGF